MLLSNPRLVDWPEIVDLIKRPINQDTLPCWEHPVLACLATGGTKGQAVPGAAAIFCLLYSIHLVDDLLDQDPRGLQHKHGEGRVANYALVFQAMAFSVIEEAQLSPINRITIHQSLVSATISTAFGQNLDLDDLQGEEDYWRVVELKTPPLFSAGLAIGGLLAGAKQEAVESLNQLGFLLGKSIQISDDLKDAFETPAAPDWFRQQNNLPILYAMTADHSERPEFLELLSSIDEEASLEAAQDILIRSGAVSFCTYHMIDLNRQARKLIKEGSWVDPEPLYSLVDQYIAPLKSLLETIGVDCPEELFE